MTSLRLCAAALLALTTTATAGDGDDLSTVKDAYLGLRASGCDVTTIGSPVVARALRNVPYAMAGKIFKTAELTFLFSHDGGWYTPKDANADVAAEDRACVRALDKQEKFARKRAPVKAATEAVMIRNGSAVLGMYELAKADFTKFRQSQKTTDGVRRWRLEFKAGSMAALVTIECQLPEAEAKAKAPNWEKLECIRHAAG